MIDESESIKRYESVLQEKFRGQEETLRSEAFAAVASQTTEIVARASREVGARRQVLDDEWQTWLAHSERNVAQTSVQARLLVEDAESNLQQEHEQNLQMAVQQMQHTWNMFFTISRYGLTPLVAKG